MCVSGFCFLLSVVSHRFRVDKGQVRSRLDVGVRQGCQGRLKNELEKKSMNVLMDPSLSRQASLRPG